jgi:predicted Rossmann-fold nucleotide-binding protein
MLDLNPQVVHFCGHGAGHEGVAFEDEVGNSKLVDADALSGFFELFADKVECVVLNACYSEVQADAIAQHINYVVGMKMGISDSAAIEFAVAFYDAVGAGKSIEFAYKLACNAIKWEGIPEHSTPILKSKINPKEVDPPSAGNPSLSIMVTGGLDTSQDVLQLASLIGQQVALRGHNLMSNGSRGVDKAAAEGALNACLSIGSSPMSKIQVYRPRKSRVADFDFGSLHIVGKNYDERRDFVIQKSDAVILLGGGDGTRDAARQAQIMRKPVIPIGIGRREEAAVALWHRIHGKHDDDWPVIQIREEDLHSIGPNRLDFHEIAISAIAIAEKLARNQV